MGGPHAFVSDCVQQSTAESSGVQVLQPYPWGAYCLGWSESSSVVNTEKQVHTPTEQPDDYTAVSTNSEHVGQSANAENAYHTFPGVTLPQQRAGEGRVGARRVHQGWIQVDHGNHTVGSQVSGASSYCMVITAGSAEVRTVSVAPRRSSEGQESKRLSL
ncbi:hypothetical protein INR49_014747 [Caranx melampygus]|nr:hypothetical protein INR49_014747 [Caranx melampygus]